MRTGSTTSTTDNSVLELSEFDLSTNSILVSVYTPGIEGCGSMSGLFSRSCMIHAGILIRRRLSHVWTRSPYAKTSADYVAGIACISDFGHARHRRRMERNVAKV